MQKLTIYVLKGGKILGSMCTDESSRYILINALTRVEYLLENYNKNLSSIDIPDDIFALRFFEKNNYAGDLLSAIPETKLDSFRYLNRTYPHNNFYRENQDPTLGEISILSTDIASDVKAEEVSIIINFDEKKLNIKGGLKVLEFTDYIDMIGRAVPKEEFPKLDFNVKAPHFNYIGELIELLKSDGDGFTCDNYKHIYFLVPEFYRGE